MSPDACHSPSPPASTLVLALILPISVILTASVNRAAGLIFSLHAPSIAWLATAAIPSALVIAAIYAVYGDRTALALPTRAALVNRRVIRLSVSWLLVWLAGLAVAALVAGHWIVYAHGWPLIAAFLLFGPVGEELLFRGLIYNRAHMLWPQSSLVIPILISTAAFSLHHAALRAAPEGLALAQILFTIPMGIVLALLRARTGSLWPGLAIHIITNLPAAI